MIHQLKEKVVGLFHKEDNSPLRRGKKKKYIFIHINKTGGTSIGKTIGLPLKSHLHVDEVISIIGEEKFKKAFVFCVVRNPWDKVVSHYKFRVRNNKTNMADNPISFKDWVKCTYGPTKDPFYYNNPRMFASQSDWLKDSNGNIRVDKILRFESLKDDYNELAEILGFSKELPHLNATNRKHYSEYYDNETIEVVRQWFKEDIDSFNYDF